MTPSSVTLLAPPEETRASTIENASGSCINPTIQQSTNPLQPRRRRGPPSKIAQLPGHLRMLLNQLLDQDKTYDEVVEEMAKHGVSLNTDNVSRWFNGPYQDYLAALDWQDELQQLRDHAFSFGQEEGNVRFQEGLVQIGLTQLFRAMKDDRFKDDPANHLRLFNSLARLSREALVIRKYADQQAKERTAQLPQLDQDRDISDNECLLLVNRMDRVFRRRRPSSPSSSSSSTTAPESAEAGLAASNPAAAGASDRGPSPARSASAPSTVSEPKLAVSPVPSATGAPTPSQAPIENPTPASAGIPAGESGSSSLAASKSDGDGFPGTTVEVPILNPDSPDRGTSPARSASEPQSAPESLPAAPQPEPAPAAKSDTPGGPTLPELPMQSVTNPAMQQSINPSMPEYSLACAFCPGGPSKLGAHFTRCCKETSPNLNPLADQSPPQSQISCSPGQESKIEETCHFCRKYLPPRLPNGQRPFTHCQLCGTALRPLQLLHLFCPSCGGRMESIFENDRRTSNECPHCLATLPNATDPPGTTHPV